MPVPSGTRFRIQTLASGKRVRIAIFRGRVIEKKNYAKYKANKNAPTLKEGEKENWKMSFLFGRKRGSGIPKNATFRITQQGSEQVQKFSGDAKSRILLALETQGTLNIDEIAQQSHLNKGQAERLIPVLASGGFIALASTSAGIEE